MLFRSAKEIQEQQNQTNADPNLALAQNEQTLEVINQAYSYDFDFKAYPDFVNPFATYMAGLFFFLDKEYAKSADLFKESLLMDPQNMQILSDFELADNAANQISEKIKKKYAWIIYEDGRSLEKDEIKVDIPLFIFTDRIYYTSIALPKLHERNSSFLSLYINNGAEKIARTQEVANMDIVMKTEFQKRFGGIVLESLLSTVSKTIMQKQLIDGAGVVGGIIGALYQVATTKADVRSWRTLPKSYNVSRVEITSKPIKITSPDGLLLFEQTLPKEYNALIYVKSPQIGNEMIQVLIFNKE